MSKIGFDYSNQKNSVRIQDKELPILFDVDAVIVGGSLAGVSAAIEIAKSGKSVALIESRTYLGREVTATLRPWLDFSKDSYTKPLPHLLGGVAGSGVQRDGEIALCMDQVKIYLEDVLLEQHVNLLYASYPTAIYTEDSGEKLLIIGNKSGRQVVKAKVVIDATESASILRLSGEEFESSKLTQRSFVKTIEMYRTEGLTDRVLNVPEHIGIDNHTVYVHQGYLDNGHVLLEFKLTLENGGYEAEIEEVKKSEIVSRDRMFQLATYLINHHPAFSLADLATSSYELQDMNHPSLRGNYAFKKEKPFNHTIEIYDGNEELFKVELRNLLGEDSRIWCLNESARMLQADQLFSNPITSSSIGEQVGKQLVAQWDELVNSTHASSNNREQMTSDESIEMHWTVSELDQPQEGKIYQRQSVPKMDIPFLQHTDVLVVGGGTSGATAAITSAKEGMNTVLLEMNPGLGGTGTLGGVDSYWFGRRLGYSSLVTELVDKLHKQLNHRSPKWNIEAKMYALLKEAEKTGVNTYFNVTTIGTIMEGNRVRGVVIATRWGVYGVVAETVIDASGDGDIAAFAGAEYVYGSKRDHNVMWYSLAQFAKPGRTQNNFTSMVHISNIEDYTRAILEGRRRKRKRDVHDHGIYVASRETRHILGEEVMTLTDQLRYRQWDDVINIHFSNHDMKGKSGADWMNLGLIPPNLEIEIPYRILLPKGLEGILIAGKAISVTHDAFAAIRMQSDLENLGGVVALAAAQSISDQQLPRNIDIKKLQKRVIKEGLLSENVLHRTIQNKEYNNEELEQLVNSLTGEQPLYMYSDMEMDEIFTEKIPLVEVCTVGTRIIPFLEKALDHAIEEKNTNRQIILAQALAMYESSYGVPILLREIEKELSGEELPVRDNSIKYTQLPPDHGAMPDVVYLIYTLGLTRDKDSIPIWMEIANMVEPTEESLKDMYKGTFYYVDAVCNGIERLADPVCIPILEKLYTHENLSNQTRTTGAEPDYFRERQAMLDLGIARALARCGSKRGYDVLINYLEDDRSLLAEQAHTELKQITGHDFQKNTKKWSLYIESIQHDLQLQPVIEKLDR